MSSTRADEIDQRLPAYAQLRDRLAARIAAGEFRPGAAFPSENQLAGETGLSVGTVRRAMQQLVDEGLLERRRGSGTFLRSPAFDVSLFRFFAVETRGERTIPTSRLVLRSRAAPPAAVAAVLGTDDAVRIERIRSVGADVVLAEEIWVPQARFPGIETIAEAEIGPLLYPFYLDRFGVLVSSATDDVSFEPADAHNARRLGVEEGAPLAVIERTARAVDGAVVEWRVAYGDATRFRYRSRIG
ncbi:GntR family transcriptional regulator [Aureimonas mangrovi]|uniref:GntR family transcriptional regulator n=1 Tax=Aureimonas mangrovi TaxID=2758041 RepID=UPI00163DB49C|nr:GntR family transcriptional regulator [Aureimonas mangrovi]